ncbi:hypothetical protein [Labrys wisconsinensis]|jgi:hypothetical protein|uniref:Uncharacterized protein n=1 Tax=Labrys wisconsinensis TaxID=425677 RepID=A0ABU0JK01_9HYPH|nr:hypothetical protein [Labrys wisconsinensis]MDQ0474608.1 hypothetical protein [Labrys wisconsinensis]
MPKTGQGSGIPAALDDQQQGKSFRIVDATGFPVCHIYYDVGRHPYIPDREQAESLARQIARLPVLREKAGPD